MDGSSEARPSSTGPRMVYTERGDYFRAVQARLQARLSSLPSFSFGLSSAASSLGIGFSSRFSVLSSCPILLIDYLADSVTRNARSPFTKMV
jgi:hypothetical protein